MTDSMKEPELKPCPFCGGKAKIDRCQPYWHYSSGEPGTATAIYCTNCDSHMSFCHEDHLDDDLEELAGELIAAWNRRALPDDAGNVDDTMKERVAKAIALEAGAKWPEDANRYRRYAEAALNAIADDAGDVGKLVEAEQKLAEAAQRIRPHPANPHAEIQPGNVASFIDKEVKIALLEMSKAADTITALQAKMERLEALTNAEGEK